jgi:hypothetical protein
MNITINKSYENTYIASFKSEILGATFAVCFKDNILGSVALHHFTTMLSKKYEQDDIKFLLSKDVTEIETGAIAEVVNGK